MTNLDYSRFYDPDSSFGALRQFAQFYGNLPLMEHELRQKKEAGEEEKRRWEIQNSRADRQMSFEEEKFEEAKRQAQMSEEVKHIQAAAALAKLSPAMAEKYLGMKVPELRDMKIIREGGKGQVSLRTDPASYRENPDGTWSVDPAAVKNVTDMKQLSMIKSTLDLLNAGKEKKTETYRGVVDDLDRGPHAIFESNGKVRAQPLFTGETPLPTPGGVKPVTPPPVTRPTGRPFDPNVFKPVIPIGIQPPVQNQNLER